MKANQGAAGVDRQSIAAFEADLSNNLYKLWNRLSSGSYFLFSNLLLVVPCEGREITDQRSGRNARDSA